MGKAPTPTLGEALDLADEKPRPKKEKLYNPASVPSRRGRRGQIMYLNLAAHAQLKTLAEDEETTMAKLIIEGINMVFEGRGLKPLA
jgi:hypothetical protein